MLLSQLSTTLLSDPEPVVPQANLSTPLSVFFDLMKGPLVNRRSLPSVGLDSTHSAIVEDIYARFGNNNFIVHSHLNSCAHGIFPMASRLFNHSCNPNCVAKYRFTSGKPVRMEVVAISTIKTGEEVRVTFLSWSCLLTIYQLTIPYLDPALSFQTRQESLWMNYGFRCSCSLCAAQKTLKPPPPQADLEDQLCDFVDSHITPIYPQRSTMRTLGSRGARWSLPDRLFPVFHADYLPKLSEEFSRASHEGDYDRALHSGRTLLALYFVIYPPFYPQIGEYSRRVSSHVSVNNDSLLQECML